MKYLFINLKQYAEPIERREEFKNAIKSLERKALNKNVKIIVCPQFLEANFFAWNDCETFVQHVDCQEPGSGTGYILPESLVVNNIKGTLLNHSEHRIGITQVKNTLDRLEKLNIPCCVCVKNAKEVKKVAEFEPEFIAIEPPKLIGTGISISTARPHLISDSVKNARGIKLIAGAGVKNSFDVKKAIELGADGVLVASDIDKSDNFYNAILDILNGF